MWRTCLIALVLCSCTQTWDYDRAWLPGDLHVHSSIGSDDTDGQSSPQQIRQAALDAGLAFVAITDHSNSTGSMDCDDAEDCPNQGPEFPATEGAEAAAGDGFVMVVGSEISPLWAGHVGCLPPDGGFTWNGAFVDRPEGEVTAADAVHQCRAIGGFAIANHPFSQAGWTAWDWTTDDVDGVEVWNGGLRWDAGDARALAAWECLVARGQAVIPLAASDNHRPQIEEPGDALNPPLGQPRTSLGLLPEAVLSWETMRRGLLAGAVVLHEADTFVAAERVVWTRADEVWTVAGEAPLPARVELRAIARLGEDESCDPATIEQPLHEVWWSAEVDGVFDLDTEALEHDRKAPGLRYLALVRDDQAPSMEGGTAMTGLLELPP
jgi:predicted metal-dependent phosphoesterase TrpH